MISVIYCLAALLATEVEHLIRSIVFQAQKFDLFSSGKTYLINGIISLVLGLSFFRYSALTMKSSTQAHPENNPEISESNSPDGSESQEQIHTIPIKKGENTRFVPIDEVL